MRRSKVPRRNTPKKEELPRDIPLCSLFRLVRSDAKTPAWNSHVGRVFRIGYYSQQDGLDEVIWLVNGKRQIRTSDGPRFLDKVF